jgi:HTH-type transcriptional regulator/antitoxin HigA
MVAAPAHAFPRDLVPLIGSRSKVSEVLARKRPLTLSMVRALHKGLRIPAIHALEYLASWAREYKLVAVPVTPFPVARIISRPSPESQRTMVEDSASE